MEVEWKDASFVTARPRFRTFACRMEDGAFVTRLGSACQDPTEDDAS